MSIFSDYLNKYPNDRVISLLSEQLAPISKAGDDKVHEMMKNFTLEETNVSLQIDPTFIL